MNVTEMALDLVCPVCDAKPREECHRIDGHAMPQPHSARKNLVLGIKHRTRSDDVKQSAARIGQRFPAQREDSPPSGDLQKRHEG
jgi:hypothetical protein